MIEQAAVAVSPVRVPVNFWLNDQRVNGVLVAEHGTEKLVRYGAGRLYVVTGRTPAKKHYTESTIPPFWRKVINGEDVDAEPAPKAKKRRVARKERGGEGGQTRLDSLSAVSIVDLDEVAATPAQPMMPETLPPEAISVQEPTADLDDKTSTYKVNDRGGEGEMKKAGEKDPVAGNPVEGLVGRAKQPRASRVARGEKDKPAEPGHVKATDLPQEQSGKAGSQPAPPPEKKKRGAKERAAALTSPAESVQIICPYCNHSGSAAVTPEVIEKPFFDTCKGCGKAFGVRIVPKTIYFAEIAAFAAP